MLGILNKVVVYHSQSLGSGQLLYVVTTMPTLNSIKMCCWWVVPCIIDVRNFLIIPAKRNPSFVSAPTSTLPHKL